MRKQKKHKKQQLKPLKQSPFAKNCMKQVDPKIFLSALKAFQSGFTGATVIGDQQIESQQFVSLVERKGDLYALADTPFSRGTKAVNKYLSEINAENREAYLFRVISFNEITSNREKFGSFIKDSVDGIEIHDALLEVGAKAKIIHSKEIFGYDIQDAVRIANECNIVDPDW